MPDPRGWRFWLALAVLLALLAWWGVWTLGPALHAWTHPH